jgi:DNA (cytosine-5)-methyltransferase 1
MLSLILPIQSISSAILKLKRLTNKGFLAFFEPTVCKFDLLKRVAIAENVAMTRVFDGVVEEGRIFEAASIPSVKVLGRKSLFCFGSLMNDSRKIQALTSLELCAGAGGQALGLEAAGYSHQAVVEIDGDCCDTLRANRPSWKVIKKDIRRFSAKDYVGVDLLAGGLPCPPFSIAGKMLGAKDERNLFPAALRLIEQCQPKAVMIENVRGFLEAAFEDYREGLRSRLFKMGYIAGWRLLNASDFGVPQLRPRVVIVALKKEFWDRFDWPQVAAHNPPTVGDTLYPLMSSEGWAGALAWRDNADDIAPTLVGGSKKHGGPDLGPTRAKKAWKSLGVDGMGIADKPPGADFPLGKHPRLTVPMVAKIQGFPDGWKISGRKTAAYRQIGNAFPPPVAEAVALKIKAALTRRHVFRVVAA